MPSVTVKLCAFQRCIWCGDGADVTCSSFFHLVPSLYLVWEFWIKYSTLPRVCAMKHINARRKCSGGGDRGEWALHSVRLTHEKYFSASGKPLLRCEHRNSFCGVLLGSKAISEMSVISVCAYEHLGTGLESDLSSELFWKLVCEKTLMYCSSISFWWFSLSWTR